MSPILLILMCERGGKGSASECNNGLDLSVSSLSLVESSMSELSLDVESWFEETIGCHLLRVNLGTHLVVSKNNSKALYSMICIYGVEGSPRYRNQSFTLDLLFARWQAVMMSSPVGSHWSSEYTTRVFDREVSCKLAMRQWWHHKAQIQISSQKALGKGFRASPQWLCSYC